MLLGEQRVEVDVEQRVAVEGQGVVVGLMEPMVVAVVVADHQRQLKTNFEVLHYCFVLVWASCCSKRGHARGSQAGGVAVVESY